MLHGEEKWGLTPLRSTPVPASPGEHLGENVRIKILHDRGFNQPKIHSTYVLGPAPRLVQRYAGAGWEIFKVMFCSTDWPGSNLNFRWASRQDP